jgi:hypothetical protein
MWISLSEGWREKSLGKRFALAGFDPRFNGDFNAFSAVFNCVMISD